MLSHALIERHDTVPHLTVRTGVVKDADYSRIPAFENARNAAQAAPVGAWRGKFDQHLVALHGAVDFVGWNKNIVFFHSTLASVGTHEPVAIAMQIETAGEEVIAGCAAGLAGNAPVLAIGFDEVAASRDAGQLLQQKTPLAPAAEAEFAHQLLVSGFAAGGASDLRQQFPISHKSRLGHTSASGRILLNHVARYSIAVALADSQLHNRTGRANLLRGPFPPREKLVYCFFRTAVPFSSIRMDPSSLRKSAALAAGICTSRTTSSRS